MAAGLRFIDPQACEAAVNRSLPSSDYCRFCVDFLRCRHCLAVCHRQSQSVFRNVFHRAEEGDGVEIVEEAEVRDPEDLALHLALAVRRYQRKLRLQRLHHGAGVHSLRHSHRGCGGRGRGGSKQRKAQRYKPGARCCGIHLRIVDQRDAAFFEIATSLPRNVVQRCAQTRNQATAGV